MFSANDFIPASYSHSLESGSFQWSSPSNIALVKYWGKKDKQIPANPSVSFTLNNCKTFTTLTFAKKQNQENFSFDLLFEGKNKEDFKPKIQQFFERVLVYLPFLKDYHFTIDTKNTFPHSSGIASSASGMAALAMNLMSVEKALNPEISEFQFPKPPPTPAYQLNPWSIFQTHWYNPVNLMALILWLLLQPKSNSNRLLEVNFL